MARNVLLFVSCVAILVLVFFGYTMLVQDPSAAKPSEIASNSLPESRTQNPDEVIDVDLGETKGFLPDGGATSYAFRDPETGRVAQRIRVQGWRKAPDVEDTVVVDQPEFMTLAPNGRRLTIAAQEGRIVVEKIDRTEMKPRAGRLSGGVTVTYEVPSKEEPGDDETPKTQVITIETPSISFNIPDGRLQTEDVISVDGGDFRLSGEGLELAWDPVTDQLTLLRLERNGMLELLGAKSVVSQMMTGEPAQAGADESEGEGAVANEDDDAPSMAELDDEPGAFEGYVLSLGGGVRAEHYRGDVVVGELDAEAIELLFDIKGRANRAMRKMDEKKQEQKTDTAATGTEPETEQGPPARAVIRWNGSLTVAPRSTPPGLEKARRWLVATGDVVRMRSGAASFECGRLEYRQDSDQIWASPLETGEVCIQLRNGANAVAQSAYIDLNEKVVKLIGSVRIRDEGRGDGRGSTAMRCSQVAYLYLAGAADDAGDAQAAGDFSALSGIERATFVGDVVLGAQQQDLRAQRVDALFGQDVDGAAILKHATASGGVLLVVAHDSWGGRTQTAVSSALLTALGGASRTRAGVEQMLRCEDLEIDFEQSTEGDPRPVFARAVTQVELVDYDDRIAARGRIVEADFDARGRVSEARIIGRDERPAWAYAEPLSVAGDSITLRPELQELRVPGASEVMYWSNSTLQGRQSDEPRLVRIQAGESLTVEGLENEVRFAGDIVASSADDKLSSETLMLVLADAASASDARRPGWGAVAGQLGRAFGGGESSRAFETTVSERASVRKEPVRLIASDALVESTSYVDGSETPVMEFSLGSPRLEVDIRNELIQANGLTRLLMMNREASDASGSLIGGPTALASKGPSQTGIQCTEGLVYAIGSDETQRQDRVLFKGDVAFVHATGSYMTNFDEIVKAAGEKSDTVVNMKSRRATLFSDSLECVFEASPRRRPQFGRSAAGPAMTLSQLIANGNVHVRDRRKSDISEIEAEHLEYDSKNLVFFASGSPVKFSTTNPDTGEHSQPWVGPSIEIDARTGAVKATGGAAGVIKQNEPRRTPRR